MTAIIDIDSHFQPSGDWLAQRERFLGGATADVYARTGNPIV